MIVGDDPFTAEFTGLVLEEKGYDTVIAEGGLDALERLADDPSIALVVSDMFMPMMDGAELFAELREQGILLPFVLLTGQEAAPLEAAHPEIDAILTKDEQFQEMRRQRSPCSSPAPEVDAMSAQPSTIAIKRGYARPT